MGLAQSKCWRWTLSSPGRSRGQRQSCEGLKDYVPSRKSNVSATPHAGHRSYMH